MATGVYQESQREAEEFSQLVLEQLNANGQLNKQGADYVDDWTRTMMREEGVARRVIELKKIDKVDRLLDSDDPYKIVEKEPGCPAAISVPFNSQPETYYIRAPRYPVYFARILSPRYTKDVAQLISYVMDIRQVITDAAIKDMLAQEDSRFFGGLNKALGGAPGVAERQALA